MPSWRAASWAVIWPVLTCSIRSGLGFGMAGASVPLSRLQFADEVGSELLVKVRWDAGLKPGGFALVIALDDLGDFVEPSDDPRVPVGHGQFHELADRS